ncbi:MAG: hypothetical protein CMJ83_09045 [Planctomycetes bacterium]|jgi:hypothetical protein|nr:hypothetical protein [Planctomycetota bacterium]
MTTNTRRDFLAAGSALSAGALVFGLRPLLAHGEHDAPGIARFDDAKALMKKHRLYGVAIAIPKGKDARKKLGARIEGFLERSAASLRPLLLEAVYVAVPAKDLPLEASENTVLLDPDAARVAGAKLNYANLARLADGLRLLLHDDHRRARRINASRTPRIKADVAALKKAFGPAYARLLQDWRRAAPTFLERYDNTKNPDEKSRIRSLVSSIWSTLIDEKDDRIGLPFGVEWKTKRWPLPEPCPPCGMARPRPPSRKFIGFLAK